MASSHHLGPGRLLAAGLAATLLLATIGCADDAPDDAGPAQTVETSPQDTPAGGEDYELFSGTDDDFYVVPDPLPPGQAGQLIRVMDLGEADGIRTMRIMYHSRDAADRDRAVTGIATYPTGDAPEDGWPVVSWAHGTSGLASHCAPSRGGAHAPGFGIEGVHVATDYTGLGPVHADEEAAAAALGAIDGTEIHPYLSKPSQGNSVIDAVRAVRALPDAHAGDRWLAAGHSQGGHGALSAHELGATYAPELELLGTISYAPAAVFDQIYGDADALVTSIVTAMGLIGAATEHPEIDPADYFTPEADAAASEVITTGCLPEIIQAFLGAGPEIFDADPRFTEPAASVIEAYDVGRTSVEAPLFLVSGTEDELVAIDRVRELFDRLCESGQVTELLVVDGADHGGVIGETSDQAGAWLQARLDGEAPVDTCDDGPA